MRKNLVIVGLCLAVGFLIWRGFSPSAEVIEPKGLVEEVHQILTLTSTPVVSIVAMSAEVPVAPKSEVPTPESEVDRKLAELGFASSANVHRITVSK